MLHSKKKLTQEQKDLFKLGIYIIWDNNTVIYVGKDSNIINNVRYYAHMNPSKRQAQEINNYLQDIKQHKPKYFDDKIKYEIFGLFESKDAIQVVESQLIELFKPKYNIIDGKNLK